MLTDEQQLDAEGSQVEYGFDFDVLDASLNDVGRIDVSRAATVTIDNDSDRAIKRQMSGLELSVADALEINPQVHRLRPKLVLPSGTSYSLGVFVFAGYDRKRFSFGRIPTPQLTDQGVLLDQPIDVTFSAPPGALVTTLLETWLAPLGVQYVIAENDATVSATTAQGWPAGTSRLDPLNYVASLAEFSSAWFDSAGVLHFEPPPGLDDPTHEYPLGDSSRVVAGSIVESDSWLDAPNRYIAVDSTNTAEPIVGIFDVPADAPNSAATIGYVRAVRIDAQGAGSVPACERAARAAYRRARVYEWVTFASSIDPRHETFDVVRFDGIAYRETGWKISCQSGAPMEHEARRTYA